ncbi:leucine-rich repeat protein [Tannerella sp.]|uniref:leucine-rich repeat protein n=1 Tax=Tannerella sp. TaxID=2382127 RepID=UPI003FA32E83
MKRTKQITRWIIALAGLMIATGTVQAKQYDFKYNGLYYKVTKKTGVISYDVKVVPENVDAPYYSAGNKPTGAVTIPKNFTREVGSFIRTYDVTEIGEWAFYECDGITSVTIPNSVKTIGEWAFLRCTALQSIDIPASVTTIGEGAFAGCKALQSIDIPASVTTIRERAFAGCGALQSIHIPASVTTIREWAFAGCGALQSIHIPASVTTIREVAFWECTGLKTVTVDWNTPLNVPDNVFVNVNTDNVTLKVPKGKEAAYKAHTVWGKFKFEGGSTPPPPPPLVIPVTSVTLNHHEVTVNGDISSKQLTATVQPAAATNKSLTWKSSDAAVASVDADGLVTIHKKGKATVTATANDGSGQSDACLFDVISTVANETVDGLRVYASGGALRLTLPKAETVHIYHVNGAMVKTLVLPAGDHVQPLPSGVYVVRVGERVTKIFIK